MHPSLHSSNHILYFTYLYIHPSAVQHIYILVKTVISLKDKRQRKILSMFLDLLVHPFLYMTPDRQKKNPEETLLMRRRTARIVKCSALFHNNEKKADGSKKLLEQAFSPTDRERTSSSSVSASPPRRDGRRNNHVCSVEGV